MSSSSGVASGAGGVGVALDSLRLLSGVDAVVEIPLAQHRLDTAAGLRTGAIVSGYPGSPLGGVDLAFERAAAEHAAGDVFHVPGVNEELAAATIWGTQMATLTDARRFDGVLGMWYGKSPGVDRCGDVFKHGNSMGTTEHGGVLIVVGDDPSAKSSTLPNDSRAALFDAQIPILSPSTVSEVLRFGLHGIALSRYSGLWVGLKVVTNLADGFASVSPRDLVAGPVIPRLEIDGRIFRHVQRPMVEPMAARLAEEEILNRRTEAAKAYCLANGLNRITHAAKDAWIGIAAVGRAHSDLLQALSDVGLHEDELQNSGVRILKIGMPYPLEPTAVREFATGLDEILVVEEKRPLVETFIRDVLYGTAEQPLVLGKRDEHGALLVPGDGELTPPRIVPILRARVGRRVDLPRASDSSEMGQTVDVKLVTLQVSTAPRPLRVPSFCSGCPHNRSTANPEGAVVGGGVGCHAMVYMEGRHQNDVFLPLTPMGAEGVPWIGAERFASASHMFQNLGDGTLTHSGSLAIRACVASNAHITFKILFNSAVAMTGGQDVTGATTVPDLTRELEAMGVRKIIVTADDPGKYARDARWAPGVKVWHRDRLADAEQELAATDGVTALVYDQRCAAEARRLRKRGKLATPRTRAMINTAVCEGCGDCQVKSNCLSVIPVDTPLGRKTQIHQSSCNQDLTCLDGDCPSFIELRAPEDGQPAKRRAPTPPPSDLPSPPERPSNDHFDSYMVGIGGTGVVTVNRLLGVAAMKEGWTISGLDQTGLSQKAGSVVSHLRARRGSTPPTSTVGPRSADVYFAFDALAGSETRHLEQISGDTTVAVVSTSVAPTSAVITTPSAAMPPISALGADIERAAHQTVACDAERLCEALVGDAMPAHVLLVGMAYQHGTLPMSAGAIEEAISDMGRASQSNLAAFRWGRALVAVPEVVAAAMAAEAGEPAAQRDPSSRAQAAGNRLLQRADLPEATLALVDWRLKDLIDYQATSLAATYLKTVQRVADAERRTAPGRTELSEAVARYMYKLLAYKDEYEVARLHLDDSFQGQLQKEFPGARVRYKLHPPMLRAMGMKRKLALPPAIVVPLFRLLRSLRRLRGTPLDPFGYAAVRKVERRLIEDYESAIESISRKLSAERYDKAVQLAELPDLVRGYEEIKLRGVEQFDRRLKALTEEDSA